MQNSFKKIPAFFSYLLDRTISEQDSSHLKGDFEEIYDSLHNSGGALKAHTWLIRQIFVSFFIFASHSVKWWFIMFKNYLTVSLRNLKNSKGFSFINITGLAFGMACCLFIMLWVIDELSFDRFHTNIDRLHHVRLNILYTGGMTDIAVTPAPLAKTLKNEFPEVEDSARLRYQRTMLLKGENKAFYEPDIVIADASFFSIFSFPFISGDAETALKEPNSIVISRDVAYKYFGDENPVGKVLNLNNSADYIIKGVIQNVPHNSSIQFDIVLPWSYMFNESWYDDDYWDSQFLHTYVLLNESVDWEGFNTKIKNVITDRLENRRNEPVLHPFIDIHMSRAGEIVNMFSILAVFVLLIAIINYMNLATARSSLRAKEIGMRKVIGAQKANIVRQFYIESILTSVISMILALIIVYLLMPQVNDISSKNLSLAGSRHSEILIIGMFLVALITGLISGIYPGQVLSSYQPVKVLNSSLSSGMRNPLFRKILVTMQFALSILLVVGTIIVNSQLNFVKNMDMGWEKDDLLYINIPDEAFPHYAAFKNELLQNSSVTGVTAMQSVLTGFGNTSSNFHWQGKDPDLSVSISFSGSDADFIETLGIELIEGNSFSGMEFSMESPVIMVNETFKNIISDGPVSGKSLTWGDDTFTITGVMKDFQIQSVRQEIRPTVIYLSPNRLRYILIRLQPENVSETLSFIADTWESVLPEFPLEYRFFDERIERLYRTEIRISSILQYFTGLALFIAGLGLFALASFTAQRRTKEIGIRKVMGASGTGIVVLLSSEFLKLVLVANLIGLPAAAYFGNAWLENFAFRYNIDVSLFLITIAATTLIALSAVFQQAYRASRANPVDSLRHD